MSWGHCGHNCGHIADILDISAISCNVDNTSTITGIIADTSAISPNVDDTSEMLQSNTYKAFLVATVQVRKLNWKLLFKSGRTVLNQFC
jgi:hypothetical protein